MRKAPTMAESERLPLPSVLKLLPPILKKLNLENLIIENLNNQRIQQKDVFPEMTNTLLIDVLQNKPGANKKTPVLLTKNSGRYLPEFLELRRAKAYFDLCDNPYGSTEASLQPFNRFKLDGIMVFSDFLTVPRALGKSFEMDTARGGCCLNPINSPTDIKSIPPLNPCETMLASFYSTIYLTRIALNGQAAVIGYTASPWAIFIYLIEKSRNGLFESVKRWINNLIEDSHKLLELITDNLYIHVMEQIKSGAQIIEIFDIFSDQLSPADYPLFSFFYLEKLLKKLKDQYPQIPFLLYTKGQYSFIKRLLKDNTFTFDGIAIDYNCDIEEMAEICEKSNVALIGNLDPGVLMGDPKIIESKTSNMLKKGRKCSRYIANVGTGVFEEVNIKGVEAFIEAVKKY